MEGLQETPQFLKVRPGPLSCLQNSRRCVCHTGYVGDGLECVGEPQPPVDRCLGQPRPCHVDAVCTDLHFQGELLRLLPGSLLCLAASPPLSPLGAPSCAEKWAGVFHLQAPSGPYGLNFSEAEAACDAHGAALASLSQLSAAQQVRGAGDQEPAWGSGVRGAGILQQGPES